MLIGWDYAYCGFPWFSICLVFCHCLVKPFDFHQNRIPKRESKKRFPNWKGSGFATRFLSTPLSRWHPRRCQHWWCWWHALGPGLAFCCVHVRQRGRAKVKAYIIKYNDEIKRCDIKYISWYGDMKYYEYDIWYTDTRSHEMTVVKRHAWPNES